MFRKSLFVAIFVMLISGCTGVTDEVINDTGNNEYEDEVHVSDVLGPDDVFVDRVLYDDFDDIELENFPSAELYYNWPEAEIWNNRVFLLSFPHVVEYDWDGNMVSYTNTDLVECSTDMELVGDSLFIACREIGIYEVDLSQNRVVNLYDEKDGLVSTQNPFLASDGDILWMGTFDGVAKIDTNSGDISFYQEELGSGGTKFSADAYARDGEVWAKVIANAYSGGSASRYDYESDTWTAYGPEYFKTDSLERVDFRHFVISDEGVFVTYQDGGPEKEVVAKFDPEADVWDEVYSAPYTEFNENFENYLPAPETYTIYKADDERGYARFHIYKDSQWIDFPILQKEYFELVSGDDVYYLLSNNGIDIFMEGDYLPTTLVDAEENISPNGVNYFDFFMTDDGKYLVYFVINSAEMIPPGYVNFKVYDLTSGYLFEGSNEAPEGLFEMDQIVFDYSEDILTATAQGIGVFTIDILEQGSSFQEN